MAAGVLAATLAGCRQPDGPMPAPQGEQPNRIEDITRDLQNVARKDANAPAELLDDLMHVDAVQQPRPQLKAVSDSLAAALGGTALQESDAHAIANILFVAAAGRELSEAQTEKVGTDMHDALVKAGASDPAAQRASEATAALALDVSQNEKRWYHR